MKGRGFYIGAAVVLVLAVALGFAFTMKSFETTTTVTVAPPAVYSEEPQSAVVETVKVRCTSGSTPNTYLTDQGSPKYFTSEITTEESLDQTCDRVRSERARTAAAAVGITTLLMGGVLATALLRERRHETS